MFDIGLDPGDIPCPVPGIPLMPDQGLIPGIPLIPDQGLIPGIPLIPLIPDQGLMPGKLLILEIGFMPDIAPIAGQLPIPEPGELPDPKSDELSSMESDMTFIMTNIMRNITPNMSSIPSAAEGNGRQRAQTRTRMARFFFIRNTVVSTNCCPISLVNNPNLYAGI